MKQYAVLGLASLAIFLPVRLVFYTYVSQNWIGNLGVMSIIALTIVILTEKNKLGWFGIYFKNRVRRLVFSRLVWVVVLSGLMSIAMHGFFLYEIDLVTSGDNKEEIDFFLSVLVVNATSGEMLEQSMIDETEFREAGLYPSDEAIDKFRTGILDGSNSTHNRILEAFSDENMWHTVNLLLAVTIHEYNEKSDAWGSHFLTVFMIEEIEALGLLIFYRRYYFNKVGVSWQSLGLPKKTKRFVRWYNKAPKKKSEIY